MKSFLFIIMLVISIGLVYAELNDTIVLKDGTVIKGKIIQYEIGKFVMIQTDEGSEKILSWDLISSVDLRTQNSTLPLNDSQNNKPDVKIDTTERLGIQITKTLSSDEIREKWQKQGGFRRYEDYNLQYVDIKMNMNGIDGDLIGKGLGYSTTFNLLYFNPPDYSKKKFYSLSGRLGASLLTNLSLFDYKSESTSGNYTIKTKMSILTNNLDLGGVVGVNLGLGAFPMAQKWYGIIMGVSWRPVFRLTNNNITTTISSNNPYFSGNTSYDQKTSTDFDTGAIEYSIDIGSIKAMTDKFAPRSALRFTVVIIPPTNKNKMSMFMIGIGMGKYK